MVSSLFLCQCKTTCRIAYWSWITAELRGTFHCIYIIQFLRFLTTDASTVFYVAEQTSIFLVIGRPVTRHCNILVVWCIESVVWELVLGGHPSFGCSCVAEVTYSIPHGCMSRPNSVSLQKRVLQHIVICLSLSMVVICWVLPDLLFISHKTAEQLLSYGICSFQLISFELYSRNIKCIYATLCQLTQHFFANLTI